MRPGPRDPRPILTALLGVPRNRAIRGCQYVLVGTVVSRRHAAICCVATGVEYTRVGYFLYGHGRFERLLCHSSMPTLQCFAPWQPPLYPHFLPPLRICHPLASFSISGEPSPRPLIVCTHRHCVRIRRGVSAGPACWRHAVQWAVFDIESSAVECGELGTHCPPLSRYSRGTALGVEVGLDPCDRRLITLMSVVASGFRAVSLVRASLPTLLVASTCGVAAARS